MTRAAPTTNPSPDGRTVSEAPRRRQTAAFAISPGLDGEGRRVVAYVNGEIDRWNAGERTESIDVIADAAADRLRR